MEHDLVEEGAWAAIVIQQGVTHALDLARSIGNANYNGSQAISVYYAQTRQESALGSYLVPPLPNLLLNSTSPCENQDLCLKEV